MGELFDRYSRASGCFDELTGDDGQPRPHWRYLVQSLSELEPADLAERQNEMRRLLFDSGISYNLYAEDQVRTRAWPMDLLPLVITSREWREVEVGVAQRAELLRQILSDIYGKQSLIRHGLLPPQLVFEHPGFLAPCAGIELPADQQLILYGADLGRDPQGRLWVTGDRTQAPSGMGYALAARTVSSRVLPSIFRESNVHPVLPFLRDLRSRLIQLAEDELERIAVLTPGPANEAHSEHVYLARQLGLPLVEGSDLQVTGGACVLVDGAQRKPISVLLRRLDDDYCDPLELNRRSLLGLPGGLQAVRNRTLKFANPLGSGILENPALMAFLPGICHHLLGEELKLPSQQTWWCGEQEHLHYVEANWEDMVIRGFQPSSTNPALAVAHLSAEARQDLLARLRAHPERYVAQALNAHATVPVLAGQEVHAYPAELRTFAVSARGGFQVMTGGLARVGQATDSWRFSSQLGGMSKDIWVMASEQQRYAQTLPQFLPRLHHAASSLQPHIFEKLLWLGRYTARAELLGRLLVASFERLTDGPSDIPGVTTTLLRAVTWQSTLYPGFVGPVGAEQLADPVPELLRVTYAEEPGGLRHDVIALAGSADILRDVLGQQIFRTLSRLEMAVQYAGDFPVARETVQTVLIQLTSLQGLFWRTLTEDRSRAMIEVGLVIEQALGMIRLVRSFASDGFAGATRLLFELTNTPAILAPGPDENATLNVLRNLLIADDNAQSLRYQLMMLERLLRSLQSPGQSDPLAAEVSTRLTQLGSWELAGVEMAEAPNPMLDRQLQEIDQWLRGLAEQIELRYMPRQPQRQAQLVEVA